MREIGAPRSSRQEHSSSAFQVFLPSPDAHLFLFGPGNVPKFTRDVVVRKQVALRALPESLAPRPPWYRVAAAVAPDEQSRESHIKDAARKARGPALHEVGILLGAN